MVEKESSVMTKEEMVKLYCITNIIHNYTTASDSIGQKLAHAFIEYLGIDDNDIWKYDIKNYPIHNIQGMTLREFVSKCLKEEYEAPLNNKPDIIVAAKYYLDKLSTIAEAEMKEEDNDNDDDDIDVSMSINEDGSIVFQMSGKGVGDFIESFCASLKGDSLESEDDEPEEEVEDNDSDDGSDNSEEENTNEDGSLDVKYDWESSITVPKESPSVTFNKNFEEYRNGLNGLKELIDSDLDKICESIDRDMNNYYNSRIKDFMFDMINYMSHKDNDGRRFLVMLQELVYERYEHDGLQKLQSISKAIYDMVSKTLQIKYSE